MVDERVNIFEYENVLMGKAKFMVSFKDPDNKLGNMIEAGNIWRYAITNLLHWTPQEALLYLNDQIIRALKLNKTYEALGIDSKCTNIPDYRCILQYAFPDEIKYDIKTEAIEGYERIIKAGKWANNTEKSKYPKGFFDGKDGITRSAAILNYAINNFLSYMTTEELYEFFAKKAQAKSWLTEKKMNVALKFTYESPLDYLHYSLPFNKKDNLYYYAEVVNEYYKKSKTNKGMRT